MYALCGDGIRVPLKAVAMETASQATDGCRRIGRASCSDESPSVCETSALCTPVEGPCYDERTHRFLPRPSTAGGTHAGHERSTGQTV